MNTNSTTERFDGLAFPTVKVRYSGDSGRYLATLKRGGKTFRHSLPYDYGKPAGAAQAVIAARACLQKALDALDWHEHEADGYVAVPGDLDSDAYVFVFVPQGFLGGAA